MNKKKNAFTLVELLASIVIISILIITFIPTFLNIIGKRNDDALEKTYDLIETAARNYVIDYGLNLPIRIELEDLCELYIECPIINPITKEELDGYVYGGKEYYYSEVTEVSIAIDFDGGTPVQDVNGTYTPGTIIELDELEKEGYTFEGWQVVSGNSVIKENKLMVGTEDSTIKAVFVRYLNTWITHLHENETTRLANGLSEPFVTINNKEVSTGIRYAGSAPNNYVYFNCDDEYEEIKYGDDGYNYVSACEVWRIIGVFDVDRNGKKERRVKIINTDSTLKASWDSSGSDINNGMGINQWGESVYIDSSGVEQLYPGADLMQLLNGFYIGKSGSECKYNNTSGQSGFGRTCTTSSLTNINMKPLTLVAKNMIDDARWYTYATDTFDAQNAYLQERKITKKYTGCKNIELTTTTQCEKDNVIRDNEWIGLVGLMSVSDIAYSSGWLSEGIWTISPYVTSDISHFVWNNISTNAYGKNTAHNNGVWPTVYLSSNVQMIGGTGESEVTETTGPYILSV